MDREVGRDVEKKLLFGYLKSKTMKGYAMGDSGGITTINNQSNSKKPDPIVAQNQGIISITPLLPSSLLLLNPSSCYKTPRTLHSINHNKTPQTSSSAPNSSSPPHSPSSSPSSSGPHTHRHHSHPPLLPWRRSTA